MCEANVYLIDENGETNLLLDAVDKVIPDGNDQIYLENIYGERKTVKARIKRLELVDHKVILE